MANGVPTANRLSMHSRFHYRVAVSAVLFVSFFIFFFFFTSSSGPHQQVYHDYSVIQSRPYPPPPRPIPPPPRPDSSNDQWDQRAQTVRNAFVYAWNGYSKYAAGRDELTPTDGGSVNK